MVTSPRLVEAEERVEDPEIIWVNPEDGRRMFDEAAREWLGISGAEFLTRLDAGEYADIPDDEAHRRYIDLALLRRFAQDE